MNILDKIQGALKKLYLKFSMFVNKVFYPVFLKLFMKVKKFFLFFKRNYQKKKFWNFLFKGIKSFFVELFISRPTKHEKTILVLRFFAITTFIIFFFLVSVLKQGDFENFIDLEIPNINDEMEFIFDVKNINLSSFNEDGRVIKVFAKSGSEAVNSDNMIFTGIKGDVKSYNNSDYTVESEKILYIKSKALISFPEYYLISNTNGETISGTGAVVDIKNETAFSNENTSVRTDEINVDSQGFDYDSTGEYKLRGKVQGFIYTNTKK